MRSRVGPEGVVETHCLSADRVLKKIIIIIITKTYVVSKLSKEEIANTGQLSEDRSFKQVKGKRRFDYVATPILYITIYIYIYYMNI